MTADHPRVLMISHDRIGPQMAGPGIRAFELARVLAAHYPTTLIAPGGVERPAPCATGRYRWGAADTLAPWLAAADVVVANGYMLSAHPELAHTTLPLVLDAYDPTMLENLEVYRMASAEQRAQQLAVDRTVLARQLAAGDCFLCSTERQRDLYAGALMLAGRITPAVYDADPLLEGLLPIVPFGLNLARPPAGTPALRGVLPGIGSDDPLLLWTGGLWDWMDPLTLVEAIAAVVVQHPDARLVFLAGKHPGVALELRAAQAARARATELGLLNRTIFFYDAWVPYEQRYAFLAEADLAVSLHRATLETRYAALRSRFLDHLWAGLPSLVSAGDAAATLVQQHQLGAVTPPGDVAAVAQAIRHLLNHPAERRACGERAAGLAEHFTWERVAAPLLAFCRAPRMTRPQIPSPELIMPEPQVPPGTVQQPVLDNSYHAAIERLNTLWQIDAPPQNPSGALAPVQQALGEAVRWHMRPTLDAQNDLHAALVQALQHISHALDQLGEASRQQAHAIQSQAEYLDAHHRDLPARVEVLDHSRVPDLEQGLLRLAQAIGEQPQ